MNRELFSVERADGRVLMSVQGDITIEAVDAIVNAANSRLQHGGGVAGAIQRKGGPSIQEESDGVAPVATGDAAATGGGELPAAHVIHAVGPIWMGGTQNEPELLASAVRSSLGVADELGIASISLPAISAGIFGFPLEEAVRIIVSASAGWLDEHPEAALKTVRFCNIDPRVADRFTDELKSLELS